MTYFIIYGKGLIKLDQHVTESKQAFVQRVQFIIHALDQGHSLPQATTLSYAYKNKLQYNTLYPSAVEESITKIIHAL